MRISWISEVRQPGTPGGPERANGEGEAGPGSTASRGVNVTWRGVKTGLGLVALLLPGGLLLLAGWVLVRALARARARSRTEAGMPGGGPPAWQVMSRLSFREVLQEARAAL
jgi:hypothetical protein